MHPIKASNLLNRVRNISMPWKKTWQNGWEIYTASRLAWIIFWRCWRQVLCCVPTQITWHAWRMILWRGADPRRSICPLLESLPSALPIQQHSWLGIMSPISSTGVEKRWAFQVYFIILNVNERFYICLIYNYYSTEHKISLIENHVLAIMTLTTR